MAKDTVEIVGAGPAGLSAALAAHAQGKAVTVYEKRPDVGSRFHGDFQGLENWTSKMDVLAELESFGINTDFEHIPVYEFTCFDPDGIPYKLQSSAPIFYLVRRGSSPGTLDNALKKQALETGITIHFNHRQSRLSDGGIIAEGPHRADAIAAGYIIETDMPDGYFVVVDNHLAPAGYGYLLINQGWGTVATCFTKQFHNEPQFVDKTVSFFQKKVGLCWHKAKRFGGSGNFNLVQGAVRGNRLYAGESAGFQDALFGFGLRYALISGHLAGQAEGKGNAYEQKWQCQLKGLNASSVLNRWIYEKLSNRQLHFIVTHIIAKRDPRQLLNRIYTPFQWKSTVASWLPKRPLLPECPLTDCDCTWCRCHRHTSMSMK
jgi:flavin-dependent dehydrogenase